jgi:stage II sporulation protein D
VIGTGGRTSVTGPQLRSRLGLYDTWARFTVITSGAARGDAKKPKPKPKPKPRPKAPGGRPGTGGALPRTARAGAGWVAPLDTPLLAGGRHRANVPALYGGESGPLVR